MSYLDVAIKKHWLRAFFRDFREKKKFIVFFVKNEHPHFLMRYLNFFIADFFHAIRAQSSTLFSLPNVNKQGYSKEDIQQFWSAFFWPCLMLLCVLSHYWVAERESEGRPYWVGSLFTLSSWHPFILTFFSFLVGSWECAEGSLLGYPVLSHGNRYRRSSPSLHMLVGSWELAEGSQSRGACD